MLHCDTAPAPAAQGTVESDPTEGPDDEAGFCGGGVLIDRRRLRKHGISSATFYGWKAKFGGLEVSDAKRLKQLEDKNAKLKSLLADTRLKNAALKDLVTKNSARRGA